MADRAPVQEELAKWQAEASKHQAEARKFSAEAAKAEADAQKAKIDLEREEFKREKELAGDEFHHVYRFTTSVNDSSAKSCMSQLATWHRLDPKCDIEIVFTSPGGSIIDGMALFDFICDLRDKGHKVTTRALGVAASMAGILLQAGDVRIMTRESWLLIHEASFGAIGSFGEVEDTVKWVEKIQDRILGIFAARSNLSKAQIKRRWHRKDWWLSSDEALGFGFIDLVE